jgi:hypothetical protein
MKISQLSKPTLTQTQRRNIRLVMEHLGIENTTQNYLKYSELYDWDMMAENIRNPKYRARCEIVFQDEVCGSTIVEIQGVDNTGDAMAKINLFFPNYRFVEWFSVPLQNNCKKV